MLTRASDFFFALKELIIFKNTLVGTYTVIMGLTTTQYIVNIRDKTFWLAKRVSVSEIYLQYRKKRKDKRGNSGASGSWYIDRSKQQKVEKVKQEK